MREGRKAAEMRTYPSWIAGLRYRGPDGTNRGRYCVHNLNPGVALDLLAEPSNPHDNHAVAVKHRGHYLGYILPVMPGSAGRLSMRMRG